MTVRERGVAILQRIGGKGAKCVLLFFQLSHCFCCVFWCGNRWNFDGLWLGGREVVQKFDGWGEVGPHFSVLVWRLCNGFGGDAVVCLSRSSR